MTTQERQKLLLTAFNDWNSGRAYVDNRGTYRLREEVAFRNGRFVWVGRGKKAPWSDLVRQEFSPLEYWAKNYS